MNFRPRYGGGVNSVLLLPDDVLLRISAPLLPGRFFYGRCKLFSFPHALILIKLPGLP